MRGPVEDVRGEAAGMARRRKAIVERRPAGGLDELLRPIGRRQLELRPVGERQRFGIAAIAGDGVGHPEQVGQPDVKPDSVEEQLAGLDVISHMYSTRALCLRRPERRIRTVRVELVDVGFIDPRPVQEPRDVRPGQRATGEQHCHDRAGGGATQGVDADVAAPFAWCVVPFRHAIGH